VRAPQGASQNVAQAGKRIDAELLAGRDDGVEHRGGLGALVASGEQPILATQRDASQRAFGSVVVDVEEAVVGKSRQRLPMPLRVSNHQTDRAPGQRLQRLHYDQRLHDPGRALPK
jgi:hypothetical protein